MTTSADPFPAGTPSATTLERQWADVGVARRRHVLMQLDAPAASTHLVVVHFQRSQDVIGQIHGGLRLERFSRAGLKIIPAGRSSEWYWRAPRRPSDSLHIHLHQDVFARAATSTAPASSATTWALGWPMRSPASTRTGVSGLAVLDVPLPGFGLAEFDTALGLWHHGFIATGELAEQMVTGHEKEFVSQFYAQTPYPQLFRHDEVAEYLRCYTAPGALAASLRLMQHLFTDDQAHVARYAAQRLTVPVLALGGEHAGRTWPLRSYAEVATTVTGGIIPGAGHWIPEEAPDALAEHLAAFFAGPPPPVAPQSSTPTAAVSAAASTASTSETASGTINR